jgi:prepilin-type N-terminal cleavage/methylation domain-containing protein
MKRTPYEERERGFTLVELLVALAIFLVVTGAAFTLLGSSQQRYQTESQVLNSFQEARLGMDQIVRDVNDAGYPPLSFFQSGYPYSSTISPFAWSNGAGYPGTSCLIGTAGGGTCTTAVGGDSAPGDFDIIIETNPTPNQQDPSCSPNCAVQWIRYQLQNTTPLPTLMRGVSYKGSGDPDSTTVGALVPFVGNIVNTQVVQGVTNNLVAQYQAAYPTIFPAGAPVPIFSYTCDNFSPPPPTLQCSSAPNNVNSPTNIRDVIITLIVSTPTPDAATGVPRIVQLSGRGRRVNPNQ